ncbi:MAG: hypothetical protein WCK35_26135 [Chloroflexota bacterium]
MWFGFAGLGVSLFFAKSEFIVGQNLFSQRLAAPADFQAGLNTGDRTQIIFGVFST